MTIAQIKKNFPTLLFLIISIFTLACGEKSASTVTETPPDDTAKTIPVTAPINDSKAPEVWHRSSRPRVLLDKERLELTISRMYGDSAREPYSRWFNLIKQSEDNGVPVDLVNLALIYQATGDPVYKNKFLDRIPKSGVPKLTELYAIDIMFDELPIELKQNVMARVANAESPWYYGSVKQSTGEVQPRWGYHDAFGVAPAFAYSAIFADTDLEKNKDTTLLPFNAKNYLNVVDQQLSENGYFWLIENRIAGDPKHNNALPGSKGGMYDNFGYDSGEESYSLHLLLQHYNLTGEKRFENALHDRYRANFYQNMSYPHKVNEYTTQQWCRKANTKAYLMAQIWNTQTSFVKQPAHNIVAANTFLYKDQKMQYYANNGLQREYCGAPFNGMYWDLIYYDSNIAESPPSNNETATYFSGPGLVSMRSDWSDDASFAVLMAGEGISRRYEDANSFILSRKVDIITNAGARIRFNADNKKHTWYSIRSASKNTLKVMDPDESFDISKDGSTSDLHSGIPLVDSDNLGGQIFEIPPSNIDGCYNTYHACDSTEKRVGTAFPLGIYETANITKYEHIPDDYTYSVGDATAAYTKKIDYFEREFLFLRPDIFVIFDRVKSTNPNFKKIWTIHTIDQPKVAAEPSNFSMGMKSFTDQHAITINNPKNITFIDTLLPKSNNVEVRGGDTVLADVKNVEKIKSITLDIPRWLEIFITGKNVTGQLIIRGETQENSNDSEEINFDGRIQKFYSGLAKSISDNTLLDDNASWEIDQWAGYQVTIIDGNKQTNHPIEANIENALFGSFPTLIGRKYFINKVIANSYKHWKEIKSVSNVNMDIDSLTISVPHYFDTLDASGRLHSFSPHTDFIDDSYHKRKNLGQWTLEIAATKPQLLDNFFNILSLKDPGVNKPTTTLIEGEYVYGAIIDKFLVVFAREPIELSTFELNGDVEIDDGLIANLKKNTRYYLAYTEKDSRWSLKLSLTEESQNMITSSPMGILKFTTDTLKLLEDR